MGAGNAKYVGYHVNSPHPSLAKLTKFSRCSSFRLRERGPLWGLETTKPSATNTGLSQSKEIRMWTHIVSLLDSLAQTVVVGMATLLSMFQAFQLIGSALVS